VNLTRFINIYSVFFVLLWSPFQLMGSTSSSWLAVPGSNLAINNVSGGTMNAIELSGTDVYIGGSFIDVGGVQNAHKIAKWNGVSWSGLGDDGGGDGWIQSGSVEAIAISGSDIYIGGAFNASLRTASGIAKWNGTAWSNLGSKTLMGSEWSPLMDESMFAMGDARKIMVKGTDLYAVGAIYNAGGVSGASGFVKWNGTVWSKIDGAPAFGAVDLINVGSDFYISGIFTNAGGVAEADYIAKWNGTTWSALGNNGAGDGAIGGKVTTLIASGNDIYSGTARHGLPWGIMVLAMEPLAEK
jgi:hypothetical protein